MFGGKSKNVGVIGLGIIGTRVEENLRRANFHVFVWNRTARAVPGFLASPQEVAEVAEVIQIFVRDSEALLEVMQDMKPALTKHHVVCCHSTVSPLAVKQASAIAQDMGAGFLDAPFTGSKMAAEKGELVYYIGGSKRELEKATKVLEASSKKILHLGRVGEASILKIATNLVSGAIAGALSEALAITKAHGLEPSKLLEAFENNANCSPLISMKLPAMMAGIFEPHFSLKNMVKEAHYAQRLARDASLSTPVLKASVEVMERGLDAGRGELDFSAVFENFTWIRAKKDSVQTTLKVSALEEDDDT
ncbi:MAG: NAD(P)-dependent oxidoreductase [Verrucomicrobiaceae bacterium]